MRILYVTTSFPYPLTSGYLRHYFLIKELSERHEITLLSMTDAKFEAAHLAALLPFTKRVLTFTSGGTSSLRKAVMTRMHLLAGSDQAINKMGVAIRRLISEERFDVVLLCGKRLFQTFKYLDGLPAVVDMCDAATMYIRERMRHTGLGRKALLLTDYVLMQRVELALMRNAEYVLFASCRDREALLGSPAERTTVVANGVDLDFWRRSSRVRGTNTIVFTGGMGYPPNADAALYLIERVLPLVRQLVPEAQLFIVGRDPEPRLLEAGRRHGVHVTGFVEDVRPYLERASVFAAPLRFGAGIQNKILEAMAMEVPVVASPLAADGLRTENGEPPPIQVAQEVDQFASLITRHLVGRGDDSAPAAEARRFVERHFVWKSSAEKLERVIDDVVNVTRHRP